jgi:hypothetical protein
MTTLSFARLAADQKNAGITFFHTRPGIVKTNADRELGTAFRVLLGAFSKVFKAWTVPVRDAGVHPHHQLVLACDSVMLCY